MAVDWQRLARVLLTAAALAASGLPVHAAEPAPADQAQLAEMEQRVQALERRVQALERALTLGGLDVVSLAEAASPAVVSLFLTDVHDDVQTQGTGFFIAEDGRILTNAHVVEGPYAIKVRLADGSEADGRRVLVDPFLDLAVVQVPGSGHPTLRFAAEKPAVGSAAVVIGNAYGYSSTVTVGVVSGVDRPDPSHIYHYPSLQTDAAINYGSSGGPILNAAGEVIAMASWTEEKDETEGLGFGIPADQIARALERYVPGQGIVRPWLGAAIREPYWSRGGLPNTEGLAVSALHAQGAGAQAGLRVDDWITHVGSQPVNYLLELREELERYRPGDRITLTVDRREPVIDQWYTVRLTVTLGEYSEVVPPLRPSGYDPATDDIF